MDQKAKWIIERMGDTAGARRLTRTCGRLLGYLVLTDGPASLDEIAAELGISRASVSTEARRLQTEGLIERVTRPGDRRDFYQIAFDHTVTMIQHELARLQVVQRLFEEAGSLPEISPRVRERVQGISAIHLFMQAGLMALLDQWRSGQEHEMADPAKAF